MARHKRSVLYALTAVLSLLVLASASAQILHTTGQTVQPGFEGWEKNPDGTFTLWFGYLNRNYVEEPEVPIGPNNSFSPGPADQGQPTHFYARRQMFVFKVIVPADWGKKELVWTVNHNGKAYTATGSLMPVWVMDEGTWQANRGSGLRQWTVKERADMKAGTYKGNQPPSIKFVGDKTVTVTLPQPVTLTVEASDDGKPGPRRLVLSAAERLSGIAAPPRPTGVESLEVVRAEREESLPELPGIGPRYSPNTQALVKNRVAFDTGLAVTWIHYRGPVKVTFSPQAVPVKEDGRASTSARFSAPGTYVIRAYADDSNFTTPTDVTVIVKDAGASDQR